ncbi:flagellar biosynthetic protein FliR [Mobilicoccus caccae]|uniref:Flagellar biosynthetic protein FliR n=1 Tax=Mobilicoccus caccae TaxID=1859295 RepID=A0ABQ6IV63_9MICO|nr:flagellar biosynthetic protein FliR [Mobilicoccus caccae]GMA41042.1 flagellar biosynthetic protein FliR [Mobilicoccus caccae]
MEITLAFHGLFTLLLVTLRVVAFLIIAPPFNGSSIPMRVRSMLAFAVALPLFPQYMDQVRIGSIYDMVTAVTWQILAGLSVGFVVHMLFAAVQAAGNLIDMFSMFAMAAMLDPISNTQSAVFGRIYSLIATTLLFATGGHLLLLRGLLQTFEVFPVSPVDLGRLAQIIAGNLDRLVMSALQIGAPILAVLFLTDLALGLVSRAVPSLNIFQLAFPVKTILVVSLAALAVAMMPGAIQAVVGEMLGEFPAVGRAVGGR